MPAKSHKSKPTMGNKASAPALPAAGGECKKSDKVGIKSGKKICCCCPETKQARDECVVYKGEGEWNHRVHNVCRKHSTYNCTGAEFYFIRGARHLSEERSCERRACNNHALERWTDTIDPPRVALLCWTCICRLIQSAGGGGGRKRHENENKMS